MQRIGRRSGRLADFGARRFMLTRCDEDGGAIPVAVPQALATAALRNLLDNALRHTPADRAVVLAVEVETARVTFVVCDRGDWPADRDTQALTRRFWRGETSRANAGSGLGLTIAAAIAQRFAGELAFESRSGGGLIARVSWPRADRHDG